MSYRTLIAGVLTVVGGADANDNAEFTALPDGPWRLVSDRVMGGVSHGQMAPDSLAGRACTRLRGRVSTENNGGFLQLALELDAASLPAEHHQGLALEVFGNGETYNVHLRSTDLRLPWQSYRASFEASAAWRRVFLPFATFQPYRTDAPLRLDRLRRIGIVAIGRDFEADLCVRGLAWYREPE